MNYAPTQCKWCGKELPKNKLVYGQKFCNDKCKRNFHLIDSREYNRKYRLKRVLDLTKI